MATENYEFPTDVAGIEGLRQSYLKSIEILDAKLQQMDVLLAILTNFTESDEDKVLTVIVDGEGPKLSFQAIPA